MASRLTVIISQSAIRHGRVTEVEEALLTELMLASGLDATLIGALESIESDSTDYLCLSGFTQSIALVASLTAAEVTKHWERLRLGGQIVPFGQPPGQSGRRIYHLPLELGTPRILAQLRQLLLDKSVQTVNVSLPMVPKPLAAAAPAPPPTPRMSDTRSASTGAPHAASLASQPRVSDAALPESEWPDLDRLVDDFDSLDL